MPRNPDWTRDELILALELFFRHGRRRLPSSHPDTIALSKLLNALPIHDTHDRNDNFRNPGSVSMKLGNFLSLDPKQIGTGLTQSAELDKVIWNEFADTPNRLNQTAEIIRKNIHQIAEQGEQSIYQQPNDDDEEFLEGKLLTRLHQYKERNRKAATQKRERVLAEHGKLLCEACGFDFAAIYGELGFGFAECHHTIPIAQLEANHRTRLEDLAIICANCHRIIHRSRPMLSISKLRIIIKQHAR